MNSPPLPSLLFADIRRIDHRVLTAARSRRLLQASLNQSNGTIELNNDRFSIFGLVLILTKAENRSATFANISAAPKASRA